MHMFSHAVYHPCIYVYMLWPLHFQIGSYVGTKL